MAFIRRQHMLRKLYTHTHKQLQKPHTFTFFTATVIYILTTNLNST